MPCNIPTHIYDCDEATAERLVGLSIRRRTRRRVFAALLGLVAFAVSTASIWL